MSYIMKLVLSCILYCSLTGSVVAADAWSKVFDFQTKMAESGNVSAQFILGEMYEQGRGVEQDYKKALEWYSEADKNGHKKAATRIAKVKDLIANPPAKPVVNEVKNKPAPAPEPVKAKVSKPEIAVKVAAERKPTKTKKKKAPEKELVAAKPEKKPATPVPPPLPKHGPPPANVNRIKGTHFEDTSDPFE